MALFSLVWLMVVAIVIIAGVALILNSLRFIFYTLLVILTLVLIFGVSSSQVLDVTARILLWVL